MVICLGIHFIGVATPTSDSPQRCCLSCRKSSGTSCDLHELTIALVPGDGHVPMAFVRRELREDLRSGTVPMGESRRMPREPVANRTNTSRWSRFPRHRVRMERGPVDGCWVVCLGLSKVACNSRSIIGTSFEQGLSEVSSSTVTGVLATAQIKWAPCSRVKSINLNQTVHRLRQTVPIPPYLLLSGPLMGQTVAVWTNTVLAILVAPYARSCTLIFL